MMINNMASLNFYNSHFYIKFENKEYHWDNSAKFIADTNYPYADSTLLLSYEPDRNIYHVERVGPEGFAGQELEEINWFVENKQRLIPILEQLIQAAVPVITLEMSRVQKLYELDWIVQRHQEETLLNIPHKLTDEQYMAVLTYKQQLRDLTNTYPKDTPSENVTWPIDPLAN